MTKRFQHRPLFISSSTCLLWGLFLLSLKFSCAEDWQWQHGGGGGGFPSAGGNEYFLDRVLGGSVGMTQGCWDDGQHNTRRHIHSPHVLTPPFVSIITTFAHLFSSCLLLSPLSLFLSFPLSVNSSFFFPLCLISRTHTPHTYNTWSKTTLNTCTIRLGGCLVFFPYIFFFLPNSVERLVCARLSVTRFPFHPGSSFWTESSLFICFSYHLFFVCLALQMV